MPADTSNNQIAQPGDLAQLVSPSNKTFTFRLEPGASMHTHRGIIPHDELIGKGWGSRVLSHIGSSFLLVQPSLANLIQEIRRSTQIMYPKDIGFILLMLGIGPGKTVIEAGTGSGALTTAFAWFLGPQGRVISYEARQDFQNLARKNLDRLGLLDRVTLKLGDIAGGFDESGVDALFLDVPNPYDYMAQVRCALKPGGMFGTILPTVNQVTKQLIAFRQENFLFIEVCEILLRYYKPEPERLRPTDRMVAHTGFLLFGRPVAPAAIQSEQGLESLPDSLTIPDQELSNEPASDAQDLEMDFPD